MADDRGVARTDEEGHTMTQRVHLHVGGPKSGTTYLQTVLEHNAARLADAGVLVVGERHLDRVHAAMQVREDRRLAELGEDARTAWDRLVRQIADWPGSAAVLSYELFAAATAEQAARALADLASYDVHVVVTGRDLGRSAVSAWQERLKFGLAVPLEDWVPQPETVIGSEWGWRTLDPAGVAERWSATLPADHVHVVTVPRPDAGPDELWRRFAEACGLDDVPVDAQVPRSNESIGVVQAELLRRVNQSLAGRVKGSRQRSVWIRDLLAQDILGAQDREPIGVPQSCLDEATQVWAQSVERIRAASYAVHGDLDDLRPTSSDARLPSTVADGELLTAALACITDLVVTMRDRGMRPTRQVAAPEGARARLRNVAARAASPYTNRRAEHLHQRIAELEQEVQRSRQLHLRVAVLQDVVSELLLPPELEDATVTEQALRRYRRESL
jgi:hypothetical protein